jgi:hypothetical protein
MHLYFGHVTPLALVGLLVPLQLWSKPLFKVYVLGQVISCFWVGCGSGAKE